MKFIKVKRILAAALAASMVMASAVTVSASGSGTSDPGVSSSESSAAPVNHQGRKQPMRRQCHRQQALR